MFEVKCTWDLDADKNLAQPNWKEVGNRMKERIDTDLYDRYNGDDGPGLTKNFTHNY